jgi:predicted amidohydrolase
MTTVAKKKRCYIIFGMPLKDEKVRGLIYNASILLHPNGNVDYYTKWFLPTFGPFKEKIFFDEGERIEVFKTKYGRIGLLICYDLFFPEISRALSLQGGEVLVCISATPSFTKEYFEALLPARAVENTVFLVFVNLVGKQEELTLWGGAQIHDPLGKLEVKAPYFKESVVIHNLDLRKLVKARVNRPVLRDIRPQIYHDLYNLSRFHGISKKYFYEKDINPSYFRRA